MSSCNLWILAAPRTGSSYLCEILNCSNKFPNRFKEHFNKKDISIRDRYEMRRDLPHCTKIIWYQFLKCFRVCEKCYIENQLPGLKYVVLNRDDVFAQSVSFYIMMKTGIHHLHNDESANLFSDMNLEVDDVELLSSYEIIKDINGLWDEYLNDSCRLSITYEMLLDRPVEVVKQIMNHCDINCSIEDVKHWVKCANGRIMPTQRPETRMLIKKLKGMVHNYNLF
ncbi:MAG: Stf0 family sulfotransferase [Candidatus Thorarchaeota archaeon]|jgi:LPS sulfotransferase NodH